jgi:hypothetical protein
LTERRSQEIHGTRFYDQHIPPFVEAALDERYGSLYSSMPQLGLSSLQDVSTYAEWSGVSVRELFLYRCERGRITVINQGMRIDGAAVQRFADAVFAHEQGSYRLQFHSVQPTDLHRLQRKVCLPISEDIVVTLPDNEASYLATLGKSLRQSLRSRLARTKGLTHQIVPGHALDAELLEHIISFNHARMASKQRDSAIDQTESTRLLRMAHARGMIGTIHIQGRLCAGSLVCRFGDDVFSLLNAHDPAMNHLGLGKLSRHLMILEAIRTGAQRFHLLGGYFNSKRPFGAQRTPLYGLIVYRNRFRMILDSFALTRLLIYSLNYQLRTLIDDRKHGRSGPRQKRALALLTRLRQGVSIRKRMRWGFTRRDDSTLGAKRHERG